MKAELKALIAAIALIAIASFVIAEEADADDVKVVVDDRDPPEVSLSDFNYGEVLDDAGEKVLKYRVAAKTVVTAEKTDVNKFILNNSSANVIGGTLEDKGYTATSIDIVNHDGEEKYSKAYYSTDNSKIYWRFEVKITFSAPSNPGYFVYQDILSEISIKAIDIEFNNENHTVRDALPGYNLTGDFTSRKNVGTYTDVVTIMIGQVEFNTNIEWKITPRSITKVLDEDVTIAQVPIDVMNSKDKSKISIQIYDREIKYNLKNKDYTFTVDWDNCQVTLIGKSNQQSSTGNGGNYKDEKTVGFEIAPTEFEGIAHVNIIKTNGNLSSDMFTNDNTFIYPYIDNTYRYEEDKDGSKILVQNDNYFPPVKRSDCMIVVKDANGHIVIDEVSGKMSGTTSSEWNYIEIYGNHGYIGIATGPFFIDFSTDSYEIGSKIVENGVTYTVTSLDKKTVSATGYEAGISSALVIPDYVEGFKVTKIDDNAFYGCKTITSVEIGDYVSSIGVKAFTNCTKVKTVAFGESVKTISAYAFYNCSKLQSIDLPDTVKTVGKYAFYKCGALTSVAFDENLKTLGSNAFSVTFKNAAGKTISKTAANLAGHTFEGSSKVLKLVA